MDISGIVAIVLALLFIGLLSGIEIAFISSNKISFELNKKAKAGNSRFWSLIAEKPTRFMGSLLILITAFLVIYGMIIGRVFEPLWVLVKSRLPQLSEDNLTFIRLTFETILATILILFVEFMFKAIFRARANHILTNGFISIISQAVYNVFGFVAGGMIRLNEWILKIIFNVKISRNREVFNRSDLEQIVSQNSLSKNIDDKPAINTELFENALNLDTKKLRDLLVPRKEIIGLPITASIEEIRQKFIYTRLSKLLIYENNIDNILGYIHQLDMFKHPKTVNEILLPIPAVPESMAANDLIDKFTAEHKSIAWVIDEFGGTAGIVTMEDLLEELFGDIKDEYDDEEDFIDRQLSSNEFIFSGRIELETIEKKHSLQFGEENENQTLSGYIIDEHGSIPGERERIIIGMYEYEVLSVSSTRIETVKLKVIS